MSFYHYCQRVQHVNKMFDREELQRNSMQILIHIILFEHDCIVLILQLISHNFVFAFFVLSLAFVRMNISVDGGSLL